MSRCFPPPSGYCRNVAAYKTFIESIKRETVKAVKGKSDRKKAKRERKEKKQREKRKDQEKKTIKKKPNEFQPNSQEVCFKKTESKTVSESRTEQLEKSDLTEEHCEPSYLSDSTLNSNKRKRDNVFLPDESSDHGKSTNSGRKRPICEIWAPGNSGPIRFVKKNEDLIKINDSIGEILKKVDPPRHEKKYSIYEMVIGSWVRPVFFEARVPVDDEDWLYRRGVKMIRSSRDDDEKNREVAVSCLCQPCGRFLEEADIYALPYTVPFV